MCAYTAHGCQQHMVGKHLSSVTKMKKTLAELLVLSLKCMFELSELIAEPIYDAGMHKTHFIKRGRSLTV